MKITQRREQGSVLMLVVVSAFVMSIVGMGTINLMGMQEIQARAELDVAKANHVADAGIELAKVWIARECTSKDARFPEAIRFPENVNENRDPIDLGRTELADNAFVDVTITPAAINSEPGHIVPAFPVSSDKGSYTIRSKATILSGGIETVQEKSIQVNLERDCDHETIDPMPANGSAGGKRGSHTCTLLFNGNILIAGGDDSDLIGEDALAVHTLDSALLYNPQTKEYTRTGNMNTPREKHTATALVLAPGHPLAGQILIVGGAVHDPSAGSSGDTFSDGACRFAELYNPATGVFTTVATGAMVNDEVSPGNHGGRNCHTATMLLNGKVLIAGGVVNEVEHVWDNGEVFDPDTKTFTKVLGNMSVGRHCFTSTLMRNGQVLLAGGDDNGWPAYQCDLYDPDTNRFTHANRMQFARHDAAAVLLDDGRVLVVGGFSDEGSGPCSFYGTTNTAEIYDPATGTWDWTRNNKGVQTKMKYRRGDLYCFKLPGGKVLVAGGVYYPGNKPVQHLATDAAELYNPETGEFEDTEFMFTDRRAENNSAVALKNGDILIFGGWNGEDVQHSSPKAESYPSIIEVNKEVNSYIEGPVTRSVP